MRWRTLETAAWLLMYAGIIAFLFAWNTASPIYNAVFSDRSAADWLPDATRDYVPGATISGSGPSPYFDGWWWRPEPEFRWGRGYRSAIIVVPTSEIAAGSILRVDLGIFPLRQLREYWVDIVVNGQTLERVVAADEKRRFEIVLPFALAAAEPATISFVSQVTATPLSQGYGIDQRELAVRFHELTFSPPT
jgi:hypothetical protein